MSCIQGGGGANSLDPADQSYDWQYTNYDPRTGAESNPSPVMAVANFLDVATNVIAVSPGELSPVAGTVQRFYRRGGTLITDW